MRETQFLILMYAGRYIDYNRLPKGLYTTHRPILFDKETTLEKLKEEGKTMTDMLGKGYLSDAYFENLSNCELVKCSLVGQF